jgi:hypothetical protein
MPKKGEKFGRRSPRQTGSLVSKPFKAPSKVTLCEEDISNSDVQAITETDNARDQEARQDKDVFVFGSDTTGSTPDICKSPDMSGMRVPGSSSTQTHVVEEFEVQARTQSKYTGVRRVVETEIQASSSDSEDDIPVATLLQPKTVSRLNLQEIEECKEGPKGEKAIGKVVAKMFDGLEFRGKVDSFGQV